MTVLILENVTPGFRGEVTQWMLEVKAGVYVGSMSAGVRDRLWEKVKNNVNEGAALIIYSAQEEQGFKMEICREPERSVIDMEGIYLIKRCIDSKE